MSIQNNVFIARCEQKCHFFFDWFNFTEHWLSSTALIYSFNTSEDGFDTTLDLVSVKNATSFDKNEIQWYSGSRHQDYVGK